ncbi:TRAP transporter large permease [Hippea maritima]|uniref:TRAP dicarboxylate transporter, DctM subunit n=1 Tax=Hippea maritima (strain ATCC 700847 / DSM 10411 / MH2) TaxID=760142 RepID=F2LX70_HIPMA|nr:TRAP transporter large permease [Hippea maritima]AEA33128.1 TRAP dicarboxylate transporter, DctM subunit [Hippea maritima DSM 10411]
MVWLILILFILIALSFPISLAIGLSTVIAFVKSHLPLYMIAQRMFSGVNSYMLIAVPLFMFAGSLMDRGGLSKRIVRLAESMVGHLRGGLAISAILSSMLFAGVSGSAAADTAAIGSILIPSMKKQGYDKDFAASIVASGGSIGVIIPPSIPMIIYGFITSVSIGKLFVAGILPGILIGLSLSFVAYIFSKDSYKTRQNFDKKEFVEALKDSIWALGTPVIVIGGILGGIFTATESAACAVIYSLIVGVFIYREINLKGLYKAALNSVITSSIILFIIAVASVFSWYLSMNNVQEVLKEFLASFSQNRVILILLVNLFLLIMGTFVETTASLILFVPVVAPILNSAGLNPTTAGVMVVTNLAIGMLTPPLGICLIVSSSISKSKILSVSKAVFPFLLVMIANLFAIAFFEPLTTLLASF